MRNNAIGNLHKNDMVLLCNLHKPRLVTKKGTSVRFPIPIFYENIIAQNYPKVNIQNAQK